MKTITVKIGVDEFPVQVTFEWQSYKPAEEIDGLINPEVPPNVNIDSITFAGFALDDVLNPTAVKQARKQCYDRMLKLSETGSE